jgi:hypothetical protein
MITHASVVSRESVAALNDLDIMSGDIKNTYLNSPCDEKIWTVLGPEFGPEQEGKQAIILRSLYGLKSARASYQYHLATCMDNINHTGAKFYEYVLISTDDILAIGKDPREILR